MTPDSDPPQSPATPGERARAQAEAESIERQMRVMERHRTDTELRTANAMRRAPLVIATMLLVALLLWWIL